LPNSPQPLKSSSEPLHNRSRPLKNSSNRFQILHTHTHSSFSATKIWERVINCSRCVNVSLMVFAINLLLFSMAWSSERYPSTGGATTDTSAAIICL
jgi:hypothetical protein